MFCYQCEQTAGGKGCETIGVCGKTDETAGLQDLLVYASQGISAYAYRAAAAEVLEQAKLLYQGACQKNGATPEQLVGPALWQVPAGRDEMLKQAASHSISNRLETYGPDVAGLQELVLYGLKGTAAYADHAKVMGVEDDAVYTFFHEVLDFLTGPLAGDVDALVSMAMRVGEVNLKVMELLDTGNTQTYGHPEPTVVRVTPVAGKAILVSGHDL
ncbi:MAG: anaerobic carbon-monoxide dehydrogenase catalytic subunit, partial [Planctomycetota bacterium]